MIRHTCIFLAFLFVASVSIGQKTLRYLDENRDYQRGLELFNKQKFGSARKVFEKICMDKVGELSDIKTDARYFSAICAIELFHKDAEYLITKFVAGHPESPRLKAAYFQMGKYQYRKNRFKDALEWFDKVDPYELSQEQLSEYQFKTGYSSFMTEDYEKAGKALFDVKDSKNKYSVPATYYYAHIAYLEKNYETALQGFLKLQDNELFAPIVPYYITQIYFYQGKYGEVIAYAPALLDSASTRRAPEIARVIAESYYRTEKYSEALPYFEIYKSKSSVFNREDIFKIGYAYYRIRDYEKAAENFKAVVNTKDVIAQSAFYHLADCYIQSGFKDKARMAFYSASKMEFDQDIREDAMFNYAKLSYELAYSPFNDAIIAFQQYIEAYPESDRLDEAYTYLSQVYMTTRNYKDAIETLENIANVTDDIEKAYQKVTFYRGLELFNDKEYGNAIIHFDKSLNNARFNQLFKACSFYWKGESYYRLNRWDEALKYYNEFLLTTGAYSSDLYNPAHYNVGYCYYKKAQYKEAIKWFRKYTDRMENAKTAAVADAFIRIGDCYFIQRDYDNAIDYYQDAIDNEQFGLDYALYQKGFCYGLTKDKEYNQKIILLTRLISEFPKSPYVDDALFEIGNAYVDIESGDMALVYYQQLIDEQAESNLIQKALMKMGMIHYNNDEYTDAIQYYKKVVSEFPGTNDMTLALTSLKGIYVEQNKVDDYFVYVKSLGGLADITKSEEDSLTYAAAEKVYMAGDCDMSKGQFKQYIAKFSNGNYILNAHFYKAECEYKIGNFDEALQSYDYIKGRLKNLFTEHALVRASYINYAKGNFNEALADYTELEKQAEYVNNIQTAREGIMRCNFRLGFYDEARKAAVKVLSSEKISDAVYREAHYIIARSYYELQKTDPAMDEFTLISQDCKTKEGAEAKYYVALIHFQKKEYADAKTVIFDFNKQSTPHQYWLAKSIILLSDIYVAAGENFQAKHTLFSIIDNYKTENDGIIDEANKKMEEILENEEEQRQLIEALEIIIDFGNKNELFNE
ncbi:MAG: tetratricopeptide repeat protein [Bacteroidota bacterium]